ncbi:MAG TPA: response regulator [Psychromonas hadalis]|nr:response regulator [Psychromonas hadalis]
MSHKILIVEDEIAIREILKFALETTGYTFFEAENSKDARRILANQHAEKNAEKKIDLAIIDWMMPIQSGVDFVKQLRCDPLHANLPIIMLTARIEESDKVQGFEAGADDYLTKPFSIKELLARIKALLRRTSPATSDNSLATQALYLNLNTHYLKINEQPVHLGKTEFNLIKFFMRNRDRVYSRAQLLDFVWGESVYVEERTVDVHVLRFRKILKVHQQDHLIKTVRGTGYLFSEEN